MKRTDVVVGVGVVEMVVIRVVVVAVDVVVVMDFGSRQLYWGHWV